MSGCGAPGLEQKHNVRTGARTVIYRRPGIRRVVGFPHRLWPAALKQQVIYIAGKIPDNFVKLRCANREIQGCHNGRINGKFRALSSQAESAIAEMIIDNIAISSQQSALNRSCDPLPKLGCN
jgi:hypothetical protein